MNSSKKYLAITISSLLMVSMASSANVLAPASYEFSGVVPFKTDGNSMYLGQWRNQISEKINPSYFNRLSNNASRSFSQRDNVRTIGNLSFQSFHLTAPVFSMYDYSEISQDKTVSFLFSNESIKATSFAISQIAEQMFSEIKPGYKKTSYSPIVEQQYYAPGYVISNGNSSFGIAAVLVQQRYLDDTFGSVTFADTDKYSYSLSDSRTLYSTNKGSGYQLNFSQNLPLGMQVSFGHQSRIEMNEFDTFGRGYSDSGDFDIPRNTSLSLNVGAGESQSITLSAKNIAYSSIQTNGDIVDSSGYSQAFLSVFNGVFSPIFKLDDLTVYSVSFDKRLSDELTWNLVVTSRQQPPATAEVLDNILKNDTASISYRFGVTKHLLNGEFNLFASYANKPIVVGRTDFGRVSGFSPGSHVEGVVSWNFQF